jgi:uncharacterized membrane protein
MARDLAGLTRRLALLAWGLLAASLAWARLSGGANAVALVTLALLLAPLLLPLRGLWRGRRRTYAWATLCLAPALIYALTETVANPSARTAAALVLFATLLAFIALVAHLRATRGASSAAPQEGGSGSA